MIQDLRYGFRMLLKHKGFTAVAVLSLALGIGANTAIFSLIYAVLLRPFPYPEPERLVRVYEAGRMGDRQALSEANLLEWRDQARSFEALAMYSAGTTPVALLALSNMMPQLQSRTITGLAVNARSRLPSLASNFFCESVTRLVS